MSAKSKVSDNSSKTTDLLLWMGAILLIATSFVVENFYLKDFGPLGKFLLYTVVLITSLFAVYNTTQGQSLSGLWVESVAEIRKVVWPTKKETVQTTGVVLLMIFVMGVILWLLDSVLIKLIALLTNIH